MIVVAFVTLNVVAFTPSNVTAVAPVKFVPVIVTLVPPATGPEDGLTLVTVGAATYVNPLAFEPVPPAVVTATVTAPAVLAGVVAVIWVALLTVKLVAFVPPNLTAVAPVRFVPVIVTLVPPAAGPEDGLTVVTVGAET